MPTIEEMKNEISSLYIKNFKKDQTWMKKIVLLPIQPAIKDIITGKKNLPKSFDEVEEFKRRKDVIKFVSPDFANNLFDFMKEKRLEIEQTNTMEELITLKESLEEKFLLEKNDETNSNTQKDNSQDSINNNWKIESNPVEIVEQNENMESNHDKGDKREGSIENDDSKHDKTDAIKKWVVAWWGWLVGTKAFSEWTKKIDQEIINQSLDGEKIRNSINSAIEYAEKQKKCLWLNERQTKLLNKQISKLKEWLGHCSNDALESLKLRNKFGDKMGGNRAKILEKWWISEKTLNDIEKWLKNLGDNATPEEIENVLKKIEQEKKIKIDPDLYKIFSQAENVSEAKSITKILRHWSKINRIAQTLVASLWIDAALFWIDVWMYLETKKEAELISKINEVRWKNKYNQAVFQLWVWASSVLLEAIWVIVAYTCKWSYWWRVGALIWLGVWVLTAALSIWWDVFYYDVNDFYLQSKEDFIRQERSELKQAILQWIHNKKEWNTSTNEKIHAYINWDEELKNKKALSLWEACRSMMFLEEIDEWGICAYDTLMHRYISSWQKKSDFKESLSESEKTSFDESMKKINERIEKRIEYINKEFEKPDIINAIKGYCWMQYLTELFNNSSIYVQSYELGLRDDTLSFQENKNKYKEFIFKDFDKSRLEKLEKLRKDNPTLFYEIIETTTLDQFLEIKESWNNDVTSWYDRNDDFYDEYNFEDDSEDDFEDDSGYDQMIMYIPSYAENVKLVVAYKKWLDLTESVEHKNSFPVSMGNTVFVTNILKNDFELEWIDYRTLSKEEVIGNVSLWSRSENLNVSDNLMTNIFYRLAKELYWYNWDNDEYEVIQYFNEWMKDTHGIYFDGWRRINVDWWHDKSLDGLDNNLVINEKDVDKYVNDFIEEFGEKCIDTATEAIDYNLISEFKNKLKDIVREELMNRTVENQQKVKDEIFNFVKKYTDHTDWKYYIILPYYLVVEAKKAGLWDLQRNYFRYQNGRIEICCSQSELNQKSIFDDCDKSYVSNARDNYTQQEQYYIDRVDNACKKIEDLRNVVWSDIRWPFNHKFKHEDDLDLPIELERIITSKENEWKNFKESVLLYHEYNATSNGIIWKYNAYAEYFENIYRWMLILISWFERSNDIDDIKYFAKAISCWSKNIFDKKWNLLEIKEGENDWNKLAKQEEFVEFYNNQIENLKVWEKTIKDLRDSEDIQEKELARQASNLIYTTVLESSLVSKDEDWNIKSINPWLRTHHGEYDGQWDLILVWVVLYNDLRKENKQEIEEMIKEKISKLKIVDLDKEKIKELINSKKEKQTLKKLTKEEKKITETTPEISDMILATADNVDRWWRRGEIQYNPEKKPYPVIESWGQEVEVELVQDNCMKLIWLDFNLTLQEWVRLANFKNWLKYTYWDQEVEHTRWIKSRYYTFYVGKTQIIERETLEKFCPSCKDHDTREKIKDWLNKKP